MADLSAALRELSEPWPSGGKVKSAIDRAARAAGLSYWRCFDIWYGKARRVEPHEADAIRDALQAKNKRAARNELSDLRLRLTRLETILAQTDPDFHRETIDFVGAQVRRPR